ncbi:hypothetical protein L210DRAFT_2473461 [Boletus edulis BED1]|uniref:Zn(2)-C6 fungal-type domain-containing protein n=1 Tax=Boletus edulis BED1 TaxID=1328754 RepID=A0AAD4GC01_BOLED|nr:hypothetical protein L210DRAFT_2473461 [Boletus edulis BED1]
MRHVRNPAFPLPLVVSDMPLDIDLPHSLHGALDPTTGIFYRAAEHPRIRTAQACNKCRVRKAKCSGERPICERCRIHGLVCQYPIEERTRRWSRATTGGGPSSRIAHAVHSENDQRIQGMPLLPRCSPCSVILSHEKIT